MREDIVAGLKNAFERGESMQRAVNAFINAGYNKDEVEDAAKFLNFSYYKQEQITPVVSPPLPQIQKKPQFQPLPKTPSLTQETSFPSPPSPNQTPLTLPSPPSTPTNSEKPKSSSKLRALNITLGIIGFILLIIIGISAWNFLKGQWVLG